MDALNTLSDTLGIKLNKLLDNKSIFIVLSLILVLYAGGAAPALPDSVVMFFDTVVGKLIFIFLIGFMASKNVQVALFISIAFVITLQIANKRKLENYMNYMDYRNLENFYANGACDDTVEADCVSDDTCKWAPSCTSKIDENDAGYDANVALCNAADTQSDCEDNATGKPDGVWADACGLKPCGTYTSDTDCGDVADDRCAWAPADGAADKCIPKDGADAANKQVCEDATTKELCEETGAGKADGTWGKENTVCIDTPETFTDFHDQIEGFSVMPAHNLNGESDKLYAPVKFE
tara:strand:+ start:15007 stop:15888 length:882 start_codon:yes stop_codon:yes gene_type:complete